MKRRKHQSGTALIEFGIAAPVLLLISLSAVDIARAFQLGMTVASAARSGLHFASRSEANAADDAGIKSAALRDGQNVTGLQADVNRFCTCALGGERLSCNTVCTERAQYVEIDARAPFETIMQFDGVLPSITIRNKTVVRVE